MDDRAVLTAMIAVCDWLERALGLRLPVPTRGCYKERYASIIIARQAAAKIRQRNNYKCLAYKCRDCDAYHLASTSDMKNRKLKNVTSRNLILNEKRIVRGKNKWTFR